MKVVAPVCPGCGAPLVVRRQQTTVTCGYCALVSTIERDKPPPNPEERKVQTVYVPNATPVLGFVVLAVSGLGILLGVGAAALKDHLNRGTSRIAAVADRGVHAPQLLFLDRPMLADANADGHVDVVGRCGVGGVLDQDVMAMFDGKTGARLWVGALMTKDQLALEALRAVAGDKLVIVDKLGKVQAYHLASGKPAWTSSVPDQAAVVCQSDSELVIKAKDESLTGFVLASGDKRSLPVGTRCQNVFSSQNDQTPSYGIVDSNRFTSVGIPREIDGMSASHALVPTTGNFVFPYGTRRKGTSVAMVAAVADNKVLWTSLVPGIEPLRTSFNASKQQATYVAGRLVMPYDMAESADGVRMAAFDTATGQRLWDIQVTAARGDFNGLTSCPDTLYYAAGMSLYALNLVDGSQRFRVGQDD
jgi:outer membrane protein assembly factor BamB